MPSSRRGGQIITWSMRISIAPPPSLAQAVPDEHGQPMDALGEPGGRALLHVVGQHQRVALPVSVGGLRHAVPALVADHGEGIAGRGQEAQPLGAKRRLAVPSLVEDGAHVRLRFVPRQVELHGDRLAQRVPVNADAIAAEVAEEHGHGVEGELADAAAEALLEGGPELGLERVLQLPRDRKSTRLNSSHTVISYAVFCLKKKKKKKQPLLTKKTKKTKKQQKKT